MEFPEGLKYTKDHEWVKVVDDGVVVGITSFAQDELGELVYVDPPAKGSNVTKGGVLCVVESTKAASDVYAPVSGTVSETNPLLSDKPSLVNSDPYGDGWLVKLTSVDEAHLSEMLDVGAYKALIQK
jgi:glycine cleavage system H protein